VKRRFLVFKKKNRRELHPNFVFVRRSGFFLAKEKLMEMKKLQ
jgi:hypothetical protein